MSTPAPGSASGGFSFGASSAPTFGQPSGSNAPGPSFTFGSTAANTPAPLTSAIPPATFGATTLSNTTNPAPAPTFGFGGSTATNNPAPAPEQPSGTTISTGGFSFGGSTTTTTLGPAPTASGGFSLSGAASSSLAPALTSFRSSTSTQAPTPVSTGPQGLQLEEFDLRFPFIKKYYELTSIINTFESNEARSREAASQLLEYIQSDSTAQFLASPKALQYVDKDQNVRNKLYSNPLIILPNKKEAKLTEKMYADVCQICDDLKVSEKDGLLLYWTAHQDSTKKILQDDLGGGIIAESMPSDSYRGFLSEYASSLGNHETRPPQELYFFERHLHLKTILLLLQTRIEAPSRRWGGVVMQATDMILQNNLIENLVALIMEWTNIAFSIEQSLARRNSSKSSAFFGYATEKKNTHFDMVHLKFALQERQVAAEALFYIAYQTQMTIEEVAKLLDLIRDTTNGSTDGAGLDLPNPFRDVPSAYEDATTASDQPWAAFHSSFQTSKVKSFLDWQEQLVHQIRQTSKPALLQCTGALVVAAISAMDTKEILWDRVAHGWNAIKTGNMMFPPGEQSTQVLAPIHKRVFEECKDWKRRDICGLLCGAYSLLLKSSASLRLSPRAGGSSPSRTMMRIYVDCLSAPTLLKSITFARLSLLPALQRPSPLLVKCDSSEFFLSVLADFVSSFMDALSASGSFPISRQSWKKEQEEELELERNNERQKREFMMWSGTTTDAPEVAVPTSVDLMRRPDCLDDMVALAVAIASLGPEYSAKFWSISDNLNEQGDVEFFLLPSRTLKKLKALASEDDSIPAFYQAFLAALSKTEKMYAGESGADYVNSILSSSSGVVNWNGVFETLRWYVRQFNSSSTSSAASTGLASSQSTSYYYRMASLRSASSQNLPLSSNKKPLDLGDANTFYLLSLLGLIGNVAARSAKARFDILSLKLPIVTENSSTVVGTDTTLYILFALLTAPLSPEIRGAVFNAIASLLSAVGLSSEDKAKLREFALIAWDYTENCQILPIRVLDQYPLTTEEPNRSPSGIRFPASSTSLVGSGTNKPTIPADQSYGILYEMELVESASGVYYSTEGFLRLLNALFSIASPPELGKLTRMRTGCTPYCEYVINYILPRATGSSSAMESLPFRTAEDRARMVALALDVVKTILARYIFPSPAVGKGNTPTPADCLRLLGQPMRVADAASEDSPINRSGDFEGLYHPVVKEVTAAPIVQPTQPGPARPSIPAPKSPGFVVMCDILSDGSLYNGLRKLLEEKPSVLSSIGKESSDVAISYAMYLDTPPTVESAKHSWRNEEITPLMRAKLLKRLRPDFEDILSFASAISWRERCVANALHILCSAAVREESFYSAVTSLSTPLRLVPVLSFDKRGSVSQIHAYSAQLSRFKQVLAAAPDVIASIVKWVGYSSTSDRMDALLATGSLSMLFFLYRGLSGLQAIWRFDEGLANLSFSVSARLAISSAHPRFPPHAQILSLVLDWILEDLRKGARTGISYVLLGIPAQGAENCGGSEKNCLDVILKMLNNPKFILDERTSSFAAKSFEIVTRLCDLKGTGDVTTLRQVLACLERLRSSGFWNTKLIFFFRDPDAHEPHILESAVRKKNVNVIHSLAWFLKGLATELHMLKGSQGTSIVGFLPPQIGQCRLLLSMLFGPNGQGINLVIQNLPVERLSLCESARAPPQDAISKSIRDLEGAPEVTQGYKEIDEEIMVKQLGFEGGGEQDVEVRRWCRGWNDRVHMDCSSSHCAEGLHLLLSASLDCMDMFHNGHFGDGLSNGVIASIRRFVSTSQSCDLSPITTFTLSRSISLMSKYLAKTANQNSGGFTDLRMIRDLLARAVVASGRLHGNVEAEWERERTGMLSASLVNIMQVLPYDEAELDLRVFLDVGLTLIKLSYGVGSATLADSEFKMPVASPSAILARSSLAALIDIWDCDVKEPNDSLAYAILTQPYDSGTQETNAKGMLRLLSQLDDGIVTIFQLFLGLPFVGNLLIDEGFFQALSIAADEYANEEQRLLHASSQRSGGSRVEISFPPFLLRHLEMLRTLLACSNLLTKAHVGELASNCFILLSKYSGVIKRATEALPANGHEVCVLVECIAGASMLGTQTIKQELNFESVTLDVCYQIAEHPLLQQIELPYSLVGKAASVTTGAVHVIEDARRSWWDPKLTQTKSLKSGLDDYTEAIFEHSLLGAKILDAGLIVLMKTPLKNFRDEMPLVRGFVQLVKAAHLVQEQLEFVFPSVSSGISFLEMESTEKEGLSQEKKTDYLRRLGPILCRCIEKVLLALLLRVKQFQQEPENRLAETVSKYCRAISDALDHTEIETQGIPCSLYHQRDFGLNLAAALREEINSYARSFF